MESFRMRYRVTPDEQDFITKRATDLIRDIFEEHVDENWSVK